jgi:DNA (cytosine-5)-methyltransferase 1
VILYNDIEPYVCEWVENLCAAGELPAGDVWCESIKELDHERLRPYTQAHFFNGIGGWPLALKLAGWPPARPVWTGSCPCQPFSQAGKGQGADDPRHLWPDWFALIRDCRPPAIFGEQVAGSAGRDWLAAIRSDLEALGYAVGAACLPAASVGAPHSRHRIFWGAALPDAKGGGRIGGRLPARPWLKDEFEGLVQATLRVSVRAGKSDAVSDGLPRRMEQVRAYGNAIVPQVAAVFIQAFMEAIDA